MKGYMVKNRRDNMAEEEKPKWEVAYHHIFPANELNADAIDRLVAYVIGSTLKQHNGDVGLDVIDINLISLLMSWVNSRNGSDKGMHLDFQSKGKIE